MGGTRSMFSLIQSLFSKLLCKGCSVAGKTMMLAGPKVGGTAVLQPVENYYGNSGRDALLKNAGPQGSDGPMVYDAPYMHKPYNNAGPDMQTVNELGVSGRALYGV